MTDLLPLPMSERDFVKKVLAMALQLLPKEMDSPEARTLVTAIALQESGLKHRWQVVDLAKPNIRGPARGLCQFELGSAASRGGVWGVYLHEASRFWLSKLCAARGVEFKPMAIWRALETDDVLAAGVARLLLFTDPKRLPSTADAAGAWSTYLRVWRPGKPHKATWSEFHDRACMACEL